MSFKYLVLQVDGKIWLQLRVLNPVSQSEAHIMGERHMLLGNVQCEMALCRYKDQAKAIPALAQ